MAVGLSSPLSKSSFILFYSWCFLYFRTLKASTTTSSKTSVSFVSSSLTTGFSLLSLLDKSAVDVVGDLDVDDCATGSFCSSCAIPPRVAGGLWSDGVGCDACCYPFGVLCRGCG